MVDIDPSPCQIPEHCDRGGNAAPLDELVQFDIGGNRIHLWCPEDMPLPLVDDSFRVWRGGTRVRYLRRNAYVVERPLSLKYSLFPDPTTGASQG